MTRQIFVVIASVVALAGTGRPSVHAGFPQIEPRPPRFRAQSDLVVLQVAVHDRRAAAVTGLPREAFLVYEDDTPQDIRFILNEDRPVAVGLVVDNSLSMSTKRQEVIASAEAFARSSNPSDELFTVNFNERVWFGLPEGTPFTSDLSVLHDALLRLSAIGKTAMYDGLAAALDHVNTSALDQKVLIVVSDGGDNQSRLDFNGIQERALRSNAVIYSVGIFDDAVGGGDRKALQRLADSTGGVAFFPTQVREIGDALNRIARDIRHRYTIGYVSTNTRRDGIFRKIKVIAVDQKTHRPLQVKVRTGYLPAPN
jgi:Ca-activated chloride channel family protein